MTDDEVEQLMLSDAQASGGASGNLAGSNAGPAARRAAVGMPPGPREWRDEDLDLRTGPDVDTSRHIGSAVGPTETAPTAWTAPQYAKDDADALATGLPLKPHIKTEMESDPIAQTVATGAVLGPLAQALRLAYPALRGFLGGAALGGAEGAAAAKMTGGDPATGGGVGALLGTLAPMARATQMSRGAAAADVLAEHGATLNPPVTGFGMKPPAVNPEVAAAREALSFKAPSTHEVVGALGGGVMHQALGHGSGLLLPASIAYYLARNAMPIQGRILAPLSTMAEGAPQMIAPVSAGNAQGSDLTAQIVKLLGDAQ